MKLKRMACVLDQETVLERYLCPVCGKIHYGEWYSQEYFEYMNEGPVVGRYEGWDDALNIICNECRHGAEFFFGKAFVESLEREDDSDIVYFLAEIARKVRDGLVKHRNRSGSLFHIIEDQVFQDGSKVKFLAGHWEVIPSTQRLRYGIRPVQMGRRI